MSSHSLGEDFEEKENELFGEDGFEKMVDKVTQIERKLGIYDLAQFTPKLSDDESPARDGCRSGRHFYAAL